MRVPLLEEVACCRRWAAPPAPEAFGEGGPLIALASAAGFISGFMRACDDGLVGVSGW